MKVSAAAADRWVRNPPRGLVAALIFGPDAGMVRERAEILAKTVVPDLSDPFLIAEMDETVLAADPARLADEAAAVSMLGGRRVVRVRGATNAQGKLFASFLASPKGDALVVVEAGDLNKSSSLRKTFEEAKNAAALACYPDTARDVAGVVRDALREENLAIAQDALADAVSRLGADRGTTRRELEKLILYCQGRKEVSLADIRAVMGDEAELRTEEACDAAGSGDAAGLDLTLQRLWEAETSPVAVVRAALGHFQRLLLVKEEMARGGVFDTAVRRLRPPVHFSRLNAFRAQVQRWSADGLLAALDRLQEAEVLCKTTAVPAEAALGHVLFEVAAMARLAAR